MIILLHQKKIKVDNVGKLICSFKPKNNYVLDYLKQGMILKKVHGGIKFNNRNGWNLTSEKIQISQKTCNKRF